MLTSIKKLLALPGEVAKLQASNQSLKDSLRNAHRIVEQQAKIISELQDVVGRKKTHYESIYEVLYGERHQGYRINFNSSPIEEKPKDLTLTEKIEQIMTHLQLEEVKSSAKTEVKLVKKTAKKGKK